MRTLVWFRGKDLRLSDNPSLREAAASGEVIPLFVLDPAAFGPPRLPKRAHQVQFLLESLRALEAGLQALGSRLLVSEGKSTAVVPRLARNFHVDKVMASRRTEPAARDQDRRVRESLARDSIAFELHEGETLLPPGTLRNGAGRPYSVFTAFARAFSQAAGAMGRPERAPTSLGSVPKDAIETHLLPRWESLGLRADPRLLPGGEPAGRKRLRRFVRGPLGSYHERRDCLDVEGTSRLSADLRFGTLSVREVWAAVGDAGVPAAARKAFLNELVWREFAHSTLWDWPELVSRPFREEFEGFPWEGDEGLWDAWVKGETGYPVVDAASRQLLAEGFVPNRARMISASFLTKHLLVDYRRGEAHYMRFLTDGDQPQNNLGWQWSAGCGTDAQPYFRVFNPTLQGERWDSGGDYVRRFLPELSRLPRRFIHRPWQAPSEVLRDAGVALGRTYPRPVVDHEWARARFLALARGHLSRSKAPRKA